MKMTMSNMSESARTQRSDKFLKTKRLLRNKLCRVHSPKATASPGKTRSTVAVSLLASGATPIVTL